MLFGVQTPIALRRFFLQVLGLIKQLAADQHATNLAGTRANFIPGTRKQGIEAGKIKKINVKKKKKESSPCQFNTSLSSVRFESTSHTVHCKQI